MDCSSPDSSVRFFKPESWSGVPFPPPGDPPDPGIKLMSLMSPALAAAPFTASATWEARICVYNLIFPQSNRSQIPFCINKYGLTKPTEDKINHYTSAQPSIFPFTTSSCPDLVPRFYSYSRPSSTGQLCVYGSRFSGFPWLRIKSNFLQSTSIHRDLDGPPHLSHLGTPAAFHSSAHPLPRPLPASGPLRSPRGKFTPLGLSSATSAQRGHSGCEGTQWCVVITLCVMSHKVNMS